MTKNDLIEKIALLMPSKKEATIVVNKLFEEMLNAIINGEKVVITGFGSFNLLVTQTKKGRNPKTGETILIEPKKKIKFKQSKEIFNA
ncbi:MAG: integration host factor subunit beta [Elusimicrobia bacterium]|nr:integration host factor subunit beta [Elusimicrobiota bacterium]